VDFHSLFIQNPSGKKKAKEFARAINSSSVHYGGNPAATFGAFNTFSTMASLCSILPKGAPLKPQTCSATLRSLFAVLLISCPLS